MPISHVRNLNDLHERINIWLTTRAAAVVHFDAGEYILRRCLCEIDRGCIFPQVYIHTMNIIAQRSAPKPDNFNAILSRLSAES